MTRKKEETLENDHLEIKEDRKDKCWMTEKIRK